MSSRPLHLGLLTTDHASLTRTQWHIVTVILVAIAVIVPAMVFGVPSNRDLSNHFRFALPFYEAISSGHIYPGWLAESNGGYGDASFRFYPPALYYLLAATRAIFGNWYVATLVTFTLISIVGSLGVYLWSRMLFGSRNAMWAAIFFALMPYHLNQYYQATMLAEYAATSILPFLFYFVERICVGSDRRSIAGFALSYAALLYTHLPLAVIGSFAVLIYALPRLPAHRRMATCLQLSCGVALGLAASSRYWSSVIAEQAWIRADNIEPDPSVDYRFNFILSTLGPENLNVWWMNILLLGTVAMVWPALPAIWTQRKSDIHIATRSVLILTVSAIFMTLPISRPIWSVIRPLQQTQFPWRWLAILSLAAPLLISASLEYWKYVLEAKRRTLVILAVGSIAISVAFSVSHIIREAVPFNQAVFNQTLKEIPGSPGVSQWWPSWVHQPFGEMQSRVEAGTRAVTVKDWRPETRTFELGEGEAHEARIQTFYYPHWKAYAEHHQLAVHPASDGAIIVDVPQTVTSVVLKFEEPIRVSIAALVSLVTTLVIFFLMFGPVLSRDRRLVDSPVA